MVAASLIDTNILVYRFDLRFPKKQAIATKLLREGLSTDSIRIPHQAVLEFMAVVTQTQSARFPRALRPARDWTTQKQCTGCRYSRNFSPELCLLIPQSQCARRP